MKIIAHRGASGYAPENTIAAFNKAVELKADYIELDIQMAKDGTLVVIHDRSVDRTTNGTGDVKNLTYEELKKLDAGSWYNEKFRGERIPTLDEVITMYKGSIGMLIEVKHPEFYPEIIEQLGKFFIKYNLEDQKVIVQSFDFELLKKFHNLFPEIPLGLLVKYRVKGVSDVEIQKWSKVVQYVNPNKALVTKRLVKRIHSFDIKVMPYTARDKKTINRLIRANVDGIVTDYPDYINK